MLQISLIDWSDKPGSEEYENLQKLVQLNTYEQQHNSEIEVLQNEVTEYQNKIAAYKEYKAEMKSQKSASENGSLNNGGKSQLEANTEIEKINGQIVNLAYKYNVSAPYNEFVLNAIKAIEKLY